MKRKFSLLLLLALSSAAWGQDFASIYGNLDRLQFLIEESLNSTESTESDMRSLRAALLTLEELSLTQGELLNAQRRLWEEQRLISERQARLLRTYISRSRSLTVSLAVAIPAAAGLGILAGVLLSR